MTKKRLCDMICVAPWKELDLYGEFEKRKQEREKKGDKFYYGSK